MEPKFLLRVEGLVIFALATAAYFTVGGPLWLFVALALAPDISMLGYLAGPHIGSRIYNAFHTYLVPIVLGAVGAWLGVVLLAWIGLVWGAHIGVDRAVGYGLKYPTGFKHTHLSGESALTNRGGEFGGTVPEATGTGDD